MGIASINPATGETLKEFDALTSDAIALKLDQAERAFQQYRHTPMADRARWLNAAAQVLSDRKEEFGKLMTLEMGKPIKAAIAEVEKSAWVCRFYADNAAEFLADVPIATDASRSFVRYQPLGIILAVMPWNFPFWQVFRFAAPALMAGNVGILKHASNVPQSALAIEEVIRQAGFPDNVFQTLLISANQVEQVVADERVKAATLTGSEPAGASLASQCGQRIKKTVLELGGSDPFVVMESADLETAVATAVTARMINSGQSCIAAKRFIVQDSIYDTFLEKLTERYRALKVGDPLLPEVEIGPLATPAILEDLDHQVKLGVEQGAQLIVGGDRSQLPTQADPRLKVGTFYPPTILSEVPIDAPIAQEEFFGPVAMVFRVADVDEAIRVANHCPFGLGASAWTQVPEEGDRLVNDIESGCVFLNSMVKSDPRLPFGGIKRSGYGRELGREGIHEFVNIKTVWIQ
ncbi:MULTISPECIES: NAD-dependent succinate-semialdehyde dehydrogenase [unclassified Leptolyngbya]|uniref:NAD-dependent succinate-semialdehyde dehydrogenase n=1 Tax=unclassified Leptolyngbya TaxID=2650499 RepID=UPI001684356E|nr:MULTISPECIES: NAD-dependent succinate-semialdehyde dehydrogenase [unclassified Leptolyngbya]MBD1914225.1 NAD-dependent succinate-semialdehyde dehydrogenase [Leptolyngbya sp. FACHB-8]MBD2157232.1 NAD-dependent succinate-semialdehyde dehydrogenase [Leptolyngbya sp. FACHB-16]